MSRNKRIAVITLTCCLLIPLLMNWAPIQEDLNPVYIGVGFLLPVCLLHLLISFTAMEFLVFFLILVPGLYSLFHFHAGLLPGTAYILVLRCALAIIFCFLVLLFSRYIRPGMANKVFRLFTGICVPILWAVVLLEQNILFSLSIILFTGVSWYYLRSYKQRV